MVRIVIDFDQASGNVNLNAPLSDKVLCLGLLEMAKSIVVAFKGEGRRVIPVGATPNLPGDGS
jgi:hypothetical protein